ncbi:MAG: tyrosine-type recombinase/integrase [Alphaproteobacteria bacterium]|nr:tyrosine-type recombinase/integrase [Alphaproteobacteria bacterium]
MITSTKRIYSSVRISTSLCYTIEDICRLFSDQGLCPNTVRNWIKQGLPVCCKGTPKLIHGAALAEFLKQKNASRKFKMRFDEMFCLHCRTKHVPLNHCIELEQDAACLKARGLCPRTSKTMNRNYKNSDYDELCRVFTIARDQRLYDLVRPSHRPNFDDTQAIPESNNKKGVSKKPIMPINEHNERLKYNYKLYLCEAKGRDLKTGMAAIQHLHQFEAFNNYSNFEQIDANTIHNYISNIVKKRHLSFCEHNVRMIKDFYEWLLHQRGYKIDYNMVAHFRLSDNQRKAARATEYKESYDLAEIREAINKMPRNTDIDLRNLAMVSLQALCGLRTAEIRTLKLKHVIFDKSANRWMVFVTPKDMEVKFAKQRQAFFMPFDKEWMDNVISWRDRLHELGWTGKDPFFPPIESRFIRPGVTEHQIMKTNIKGNKSIRNIFRKVFNDAGVRYLNPHSFRHTIIRWASAQSAPILNAASQSLGHSHIQTSMQYYGQLPATRIGEILNEIEVSK